MSEDYSGYGWGPLGWGRMSSRRLHLHARWGVLELQLGRRYVGIYRPIATLLKRL